MPEKWPHRADLAEEAITERHAAPLWRLPRTNLAVVAWPPRPAERSFVHWHYWWQAHYLDCQIDAALRRPTKTRRGRVADTLRAIKLRSRGDVSKNRYYDDKAWLAVAWNRALALEGIERTKSLDALEFNILAGIDPDAGVLPWRAGETFFNVPSNGPASILFARTGRLDKARTATDWIFDNLSADSGLINDGIRMRMNGPEVVDKIYTYNQGTVLGASLEIALALREDVGLGATEPIDSFDHSERADDSVFYITHIRELVKAIALHLATPQGVILCPPQETRDGDGALFKGILARYLADVALRLPEDSRENIATRKVAARMVMASAESLWNRRLEVDGLPVFASEWTQDARLPHNYGLGPATISEAVGLVRIDERDLSVQLSGWMLLEAAARIATAAARVQRG
ncbi:glycoside hydrolase family 76 protein [Corynebacterium liangguodongii]|uniref:Glycoside hydrolase family 76 n=1 Tax=Corynebacterium liangguodongii TaxID=2079535 RepID=A0A2S0WG13_9CORY|nr:glycoside hydrolase family 76 protein [Corynebacterium liangguodongii]AWB84715.1 glycoside hydrolase family 76 [Corynebacterium liangguodongii]PWB99723.1 glycoside hydrolase family 76 [Corynebacterium liangguodongii]